MQGIKSSDQGRHSILSDSIVPLQLLPVYLELCEYFSLLRFVSAHLLVLCT